MALQFDFWNDQMHFRPSDAEFQVELEGAKKVHSPQITKTT